MEQTTQLIISGIAPDVDEPTLQHYLTSIVKFKSLEIIRDLDTGESRGYAVLWIAQDVKDEVISKLQDIELKNRVIRAWAMPLILPGEMAVRDWLQRHTEYVLRTIGIKLGDNVLDYGCGPGLFTIPCARIIGERGIVYALDVRDKALERVRESADSSRLSIVKTILQNPERITIPLQDNSLDVVYIFDVLHDIKDKQDVLKEAHRVLKMTGFLSIFPMHWGDEPLFELVNDLGLFSLRDKFSPRNSKSASSISNFVKNQ
jgi:SAM-dependent methyltransferase